MPVSNPQTAPCGQVPLDDPPHSSAVPIQHGPVVEDAIPLARRRQSLK
jgi:hypothetical protein